MKMQVHRRFKSEQIVVLIWLQDEEPSDDTKAIGQYISKSLPNHHTGLSGLTMSCR